MKENQVRIKIVSKLHLVIPDPHAHPQFKNERADYLGKLIVDLKPDVVINLGDMFDMPSMSSYDKGTKSFQGRSYAKDLNAGREFDDRMWSIVRKAKKKLPFRVFFEGNHEYRLTRALELSPELEDTISFKDFGLEDNYDKIVRYYGNTPGVYNVDGVNYAHFFISGVKGLPISGEHLAYNLVTKQLASCTCGHIHTTDFHIRKSVEGRTMMGLVAGVYQDYDAPWAGNSNELWWKGVIVKHNVEDGSYEPQWVSLETLRKTYG